MRRLALAAALLIACDDGASPEPGFSGRFLVEITNRSDRATLVSGFAPGAWALHTAPDPYFTAGAADRGEGLEALAEDGVPGLFARDALAQGFFSTDASDNYADAPVHPGESITFAVEVPPDTTPQLSFAMMFGESNDWFMAPAGAGIALFDADGAPIAEQDVSDQIQVWDAGTEADQPLGMGADQAPRQTVSGQGRPEGLVAATAEPPPALQIGLEGGRVQLEAAAPMATWLWVMHGDDFEPIAAFEPASAALLAFAESGDPAGLLAAWPVDTLLVGQHSGADPATAPIDPARPWLTVIGQMADAPEHFVWTAPVRLVTEDGMLRAEADVAAALAEAGRVWSVGPEPAVVRAVDNPAVPPADQLVEVVIRAL